MYEAVNWNDFLEECADGSPSLDEYFEWLLDKDMTELEAQKQVNKVPCHE